MSKKLLAILLSMTVIMSMCFAGTSAVFAEDGQESQIEIFEEGDVPEELADVIGPEEVEAEPAAIEEEGIKLTQAVDTIPPYSIITPADINKADAAIHLTPKYTSMTTYYYYVEMPSAGTLILSQYSAAGNSVYPYVTGEGVTGSDTTTLNDGTFVKTFIVPSAQTVLVDFTVYKNDQVGFSAAYVPNKANTITAPTKDFSSFYQHGGTDSTSTTSQFKVKVPSAGYLALDICDAWDTSGIYIKTTGFKDFEYIANSNMRRYIGVKAGTYTFTVKGYTPMYQFRVKLYKVSQSKYGTSKKKAATIKAKKAAKGLIVTNAKKVHWYKFKNTKLHKVSVTVTAKHNDGGSGVGGYKVTFYDKKRSMGSTYIYEGTASKTVSLYTIGKKNKLVKGTYWIKVESYKGGNGYFTVKWK